MPILLSLASLVPAHAADVDFEGFYRARFRAFDTLSLEDNTQTTNEGLAAIAQHRLMLEPRFLISDKVAFFTEIKALDGVPWGESQRAYTRFNKEVAPNVFEYDLSSPASSDTAASPALLDITLWRAWAEVYTPIGQFTFGRVPLMWGKGVWLNDGLSVDPLSADYGDTTDRVMWEDLIEDQFYLRAAVDVPAENFANQGDDTTAVDLGLGYKTEDLNSGLLLQLDHTGTEETNGTALNVFTADGTADVTLGKLDIGGELIGQFGGGDLTNSIDDTNITAFGGVIDASLTLDDWRVRARGGLASGDSTPTDKNLRTFTFDRDYSPGMFLFEQPMPTLGTSVASASSANGGRDFTQVVTGNALSNAVFVNPSIGRRIVDGFWVDASWLGANMAKAPTLADGTKQHRGYGSEIQLGATYDGIEHFLIDAHGGLFLPGSAYSIDSTGHGTPYDRAAFGFQLAGTIKF